MNIPLFPTLETSRLSLRRLEVRDWRQISFLRTDPQVNRFVQRSSAASQEKAIAFINKIGQGFEQGNMYYWCICQQVDPVMLGSICLWNFSDDRKTAETGYDLHPEFQGKGIMQEAMEVVLDFGFGVLQLDTILAFTHHDNVPSRKLLERNHFQFLESRQDAHNKDNVIYKLLSKAYNQEEKLPISCSGQ